MPRAVLGIPTPLTLTLVLSCFAAACESAVFDGSGPSDPPGYSNPGDPTNPSLPPADPNADFDNDGFTQGAGDCHDGDPMINPGAVEVEGIRCSVNDECPSGKCVGGYCRCAAPADCASGKTCASHSDCTFSGEVCKEGRCTSTFGCMDPPQGMPNPGQKVCRDNRDNDCDGKVDELPVACDNGQLGEGDPRNFARSMDLCDEPRVCDPTHPCTTGLKCVGGQCTRVTGAYFNADASPEARAITGRFAENGPVQPRAGQSFVVLSTGKARYNPQVSCPQTGTAFSNEHNDPDPATTDPKAFDYIGLTLEIVVPQNAQSFDFNFHFFSTEYPEWITSKFNDTFWVHLESQKFTGNISFDKNGTPIRIKSAFFDICDPDPAKPQTEGMCSQPASMLTGTGYAKDCSNNFKGDPGDPSGGPDLGKANGGSTGWLHTSAPVTPGETIRLTFSIFDKGDHKWDSAVVIDNFRWKLAAAGKPITGTIE